MTKAQQNAERLLFNYETTYRTDFGNKEIREYPKTLYQTKPSHEKRKTHVLRSIHTLTEWKDMPPFNILQKPKEVIGTNPSDVQQPFDILIDRHREEAQKTRPRLVMTPAVSTDEITDRSARDLLISDMYTSSTTRSLRDAVKSIKYNNLKAPLPGLPAPSNSIFLPKLQPPIVSPEWRMESVTWDQRQMRSHCVPTQRFWLKQKVPKCEKCDESAAVRVHRKMLRDLKRGNP